MNLARHERLRLYRLARSQDPLRARRALIILGLARGDTYRSLRQRLGTSPAMVRHWKRRFEEQGIAGLRDRRGVANLGVYRCSPTVAQRIVQLFHASGHGSYPTLTRREIARRVGVSVSTVCRRIAASASAADSVLLERPPLSPSLIWAYQGIIGALFDGRLVCVALYYPYPPRGEVPEEFPERRTLAGLQRFSSRIPRSRTAAARRARFLQFLVDVGSHLPLGHSAVVYCTGIPIGWRRPVRAALRSRAGVNVITVPTRIRWINDLVDRLSEPWDGSEPPTPGDDRRPVWTAQARGRLRRAVERAGATYWFETNPSRYLRERRPPRWSDRALRELELVRNSSEDLTTYLQRVMSLPAARRSDPKGRWSSHLGEIGR